MMTEEDGKQVLLRCVEGLRVGARWLYGHDVMYTPPPESDMHSGC